MIKSCFFYILGIFLLLSACNTNSTPVQQSAPILPQQAPVMNEPKSSGRMTNQPIEEIKAVSVNKDLTIPPKELLGYVQQAIIPTYKDWVIFENGTYIIFDNVDTIPDIQKAALEYLASYQPNTPSEQNWDFTISDLDQIEGWSVYGNGYGIYTFVHQTELSENANPQQVGAYGKAKRALDEKKPKIRFVSSKDGISELQ